MTKKEIFKIVFDDLANRKHLAELLAYQNKKLAETNSAFYDLEIKERELKLELGKLKFENKNTETIEKELKTIEKDKKNILKKHNLTLTDLIPNYNCEKCKDTGVRENKLCECAIQLYNNKIMEQCNVELNDIPLLNNYNYEFFNNKEENDYAKKCVEKLEEIVNNFNKTQLKNIIMSGAPGTGKTFLSKCVAKELISKGITTLFISSFDLNSLFLEEHLSPLGDKNNLKDLIDVDCLIIDDLGTEPLRKNVTKEYLLVLLNERLSKNKSTIITTNLNPEQILEKYEERIFSRIFNKRSTLALNFVGKNTRLKRN